jgi:hypothetical protein
MSHADDLGDAYSEIRCYRGQLFKEKAISVI